MPSPARARIRSMLRYTLGPARSTRPPHPTMPDILSALVGFTTRLDLEARLAPLAPQRWQGRCGSPTLHLDDVSGIPFLVGVSGVEEYQHRARLRCSDGDLFVTVTAPARGYERYCRGRLGLGTPTHLLATPPANPLAVAAGAPSRGRRRSSRGRPDPAGRHRPCCRRARDPPLHGDRGCLGPRRENRRGGR